MKTCSNIQIAAKVDSTPNLLLHRSRRFGVDETVRIGDPGQAATDVDEQLVAEVHDFICTRKKCSHECYAVGWGNK